MKETWDFKLIRLLEMSTDNLLGTSPTAHFYVFLYLKNIMNVPKLKQIFFWIVKYNLLSLNNFQAFLTPRAISLDF